MDTDDVMRDKNTSVGNETYVGQKGLLRVPYDKAVRKVTYEVVEEIWRTGQTRDTGHYIPVKAGSAWQAWVGEENPNPSKEEKGYTL